MCGKLKTLAGLLNRFKPYKDKVLIFSWSTKTLNVLQAYARTQGRLEKGLASPYDVLCTTEQFRAQ
jgi:hypothetical protein